MSSAAMTVAMAERFTGLYGSTAPTLFHVEDIPDGTSTNPRMYDMPETGLASYSTTLRGEAIHCGIAWRLEPGDQIRFGVVLMDSEATLVLPEVSSWEVFGGLVSAEYMAHLEALMAMFTLILATYDALEEEVVYGARRNRRRGQSQVQRLGTVRTLRLDAVRRYEQQAHQGGTHESPCRHWVRPFKRRLKSGRVVAVRGHYRGEGAPTVPTVRVA